MKDNQTNKEHEMTIPIVTERTLAQKYQAICNGHIGGWYGTCYANRSDALTDANNHNTNSHGGDNWATVVRRTCD
ncbi:hypothetical protein [Bacillus sp. GM_Baccil_2]|uniref:hypothetical protein n=1 Tax=Bacillus sp. GM_Baccil_2 TaxID=2937369 RepID=UPI0022698F5D